MKTQIKAPEGAAFRVQEEVRHVNYKPHPYVIGSKHVVWAADHHGGILDTTAMDTAEKNGITCAMPGCRLGYREHTYDKVIFVETLGDYPELKDVPGLQEWLPTIKEQLEAEQLDGVAFVQGKVQTE